MSGTTAGAPALTEEQRAASASLVQIQAKVEAIESKIDAATVGQIKGPRGSEFGGDCNQLSEMTHSSALIANSLGDSDSAQMLQSLSVGFSQISMGAMALSGGGAAAGAGASSAGSMGALAAAGPYIAIAAGAMVLGSALFGKKKKDDGLAKAFEALFAALQQIGKMVQQVLKNQEMMFGVMQVTLKAVRDLESRVMLQHKEMRAVTNFIMTKDLESKLLLLQMDLQGTSAVSMTRDDKRLAFQELTIWLRRHLSHSSMNQLASSSASPKLAVEILREYQHSPWMMIGFVAAQLKSRLGSVIPDQFLHLPPLPLYMHTARIFLLARARATDIASDDACASLCDDMKAQIAQYQGFVDFLKTNKQVWVALLDQFEHKRNMVGRAISNADVKNTDDTLGDQVSDEVKRMSLMQSLDELESTRLLLQTTGVLVGLSADADLKVRIEGLESKSAVLVLTGKQLHAPRTDYHSAIEDRDESKMRLAMRSGVPSKKTYASGSPMNHIFYAAYNQWGKGLGSALRSSIDFTYYLAKYLSDHVRDNDVMGYMDMGTNPSQKGHYRSWWKKNTPSRMSLGSGDYGAMILQVAMGYRPDWMKVSKRDYLSPLESCHGGQPESRVWGLLSAGRNGVFDVKDAETLMVCAATLRESGLLSAKKLRNAYAYYQAMDRGELAFAESVLTSEGGVDTYSLLWLVALLGRWELFTPFVTRPDLNIAQTLGHFEFYNEGRSRFTSRHCKHHRGWYPLEFCPGKKANLAEQDSGTTPLMVAAEHGRADVIEGLIALHDVGHDIGLATCWSNGTSAATRAFERGFFEIAKRLYDLGAPLSDTHRAELAAKGLAGGPLAVPVREEVAELDALAHRADQSEDEELLRAMDNLVDVSKDVFERELPRGIEAVADGTVLAALEVSRAENGAMRAQMNDLQTMLVQLMTAQGIAPPVAAPAFAFAPPVVGVEPPVPPHEGGEAKEEPVAEGYEGGV